MTGSALYGKQTVTRIMQEKGITRKKDGGGIMNWAGLHWQRTDNMAALLTKCSETPPPLLRADEIDPDVPF